MCYNDVKLIAGTGLLFKEASSMKKRPVPVDDAITGS